MNSTELRQSSFRDWPEVFNPVYMIPAIGKFILSMPYPIVLFVSNIYQAVIRFESIGIYHWIRCYLIPGDGQ